MGDIWLSRPGLTGKTIVDFLAKWLPGRYELEAGWETRSRSSGGLEVVQGIGIHHDASLPTATLVATLGWSTVNSPDRPIGNGSGTRSKDGPRFRLWAAGASNTQGKGGPVLTTRGVIPLNDANRRMVSIEWMNAGTGEPWTTDEEDLYLLVVCAVLDWATCETAGPALTPGDVFAHFEWTNPGAPLTASTRKIDPWGPSRWNGHTLGKWDMGLFRRELAAVYFAGLNPPTTQTPDPPTEEDDMPKSQIIRASDGTAQQQRAWFILSPDSIAWCRHTKQLVKGRKLGWYSNAADDADPDYTAQEIQEMLDAFLVEGGAVPPGFTRPAA